MTFAEPDRATFLEVNRTRIRAWCWGDASHPPVILVHGGHDHGRMWDGVAPRLASFGFHAVAIDVRGHGDSGRLPSGMLWSAAAVDLCELARVLSPDGDPVGMIGHSMGAGQVLTAAGTAPERVAWVVVLDGLGPPEGAFDVEDLTDATTIALDRIVRQRLRPRRVWASREQMVARRSEVNVRLPAEALAHLVEHGSVEVEGGYTWKSDPVLDIGLPDGFSVAMVLASFDDVEAPVLALMASEDDTWSDLDDAEIDQRVARFRDARWRSVPGAGHYVHVEQPGLVVAEIRSFLEELGVIDEDAG